MKPAAVLLLLPAGILAQDVDQILNKYIAAVGGQEAIQKVTSRAYKGTAENTDDGWTAPVELYAKAPDQYLMILKIPDYAVREAVNGGGGWTQNPDDGVRDMSRGDLASARRDHDLHRETRLKELYPSMTVAGKANVGDREAWVIEAKPPQGEAEKLYFDTQTGLLLKRDFVRVTMEDGITQNEVFYEDYKDVGGLKLPFTVRRGASGSWMIYRYSEIRNNAPVDEAALQKPAK